MTTYFAYPLTPEQVDTITDRITACIATANNAFNLKLQTPEIRFDVHGSAWGYFIRRNGRCALRFNPTLFSRHFDEGIADTVPHEVAHYVVDQRFRRRRKPHGTEWREVMGLFGVKNPRATHQTPLDGLPVRRQQRYIYYCGCGEIHLSATRHNRIAYQGARYLCKKCKQTLSPIKVIE